MKKVIVITAGGKVDEFEVEHEVKEVPPYRTIHLYDARSGDQEFEKVTIHLGDATVHILELKAEAPAEEERGEEGTPLRELGLSTRVHNVLCRRCPRTEEGRVALFVEDILAVLEKEGEVGLFAIKDFGKKALDETLTALRAKGFLPPEEPVEE